MRFEFYVLNYNFNKKEIITYNIFNNERVQLATERVIRRYLRAPSKFKSKSFLDSDEKIGFEALCAEIRSVIAWQERGRCEYEISVGSLFEDNINKFVKVDCYDQAEPNIEMIVRECIYQYKKQLKESKNERS